MKKVLTIFLSLVVIFYLTGCSNIETNKEHVTYETPTASQPSLAGEQNKNQTDSTKEVTTEKKISSLNIIIGGTTFTATLENNDAAKTFVAHLPLTIKMSELNGNEKFNYLSSNLPANTVSNPDTINEGDLMLYGNNCLVLFYKTFRTSYSYVKLGHIIDTTGLAKALGSGDVRVTFSISN